MRLNNFLLLEEGGGRATAINQKTFDTLVKTKFKDSFYTSTLTSSNHKNFHRGTRTSLASILYLDPKKFIRSSVSNQNYYTLIMSYDPSWSKYPPRDKCIIGTTSISTASNYGKPYFVLPENNARIGIAPKCDIWSSFNATLGGSHYLMPLLDLLENLFIEVSMADEAQDTLAGFKKACSLAENKISSMDEEDKNTWYALTSHHKYDKKKGLYKWVTEIFSPTSNNFEVIKVGERFNQTDVELWTDGECLLCTSDVLLPYKTG